MFQSTTIPILEQVLDFTQTRHELLAGNIANAETPNYKARDLSVETFQSRLREAIEAGNAIRNHSSSGFTAEDLDSDMTRVEDSIKHILFHDKSDISMEHQVAEMSKNQMQHNLAISILSSQFRLMQAAVSERV